MTALRKTFYLLSDAAPFAIRAERASDVAPAKRCWTQASASIAIRAPASACATDARPPKALPSRTCAGRLVGTVRLWHVNAGGKAALVLGPLAVDPSCAAAASARR